jgi:hypothetical protein
LLLDEDGEAFDKGCVLEQLRSQPEDEVADVLDREMDRVDRAPDSDGSVFVLGGQILDHVLECEADGV